MGFTVWLMTASLLGLGAGGMIGKLVCAVCKGGIHYVYSCCGGMLFGLLCFEIIPHSLHYYHLTGVAVGMVNGYLFMVLLESYLHKHTVAHERLWPFLLFIALALHTIPSGLSIGVTMGYSSFLTSSFLMALIIHQVPEGVALMVSLSAGKWNEWFFLLIALLLAATLGISMLAGHEIQVESVKMNALLAGTAIGTFGYVTINDMLWKSFRELNFLQFIGTTLLGLLVIKLYFFFF
jgi:ZIP family zinc transporter